MHEFFLSRKTRVCEETVAERDDNLLAVDKTFSINFE